jgi:hypothetical protein
MLLNARTNENIPKVDETALGEEDDVTTVGHGEAVNLRLDLNSLLGVSLQPGDVDFDIEVTNAR